MTAVATATTSTVRTLTSRRFVVHYLQMLAAMGAGMLVFGTAAMTVLPSTGAVVDAVLMATWMSLGMIAWMAWQRHPVRAIVEMCLAMYLAFAVLFPFHWAGALSGDGVMIVGHVLMLPAMAIAMLRGGGR